MTTADRICMATLAYYYALGRMAMTSTEVWQWQMDERGLPTTQSLYSLRDALKNMTDQGLTVAENGFYHLSSTQSSFSERRLRMAQTIQKRVLCRRKAVFLRFIPFVRLVRMSGSLATANADAQSDLDLSIGVARGRLWIARALVTLTAHLLGVRRWGTHTTNRLCFNHYTALSNAPYGNSDPAFFHVERTSIPLWPTNEHRETVQQVGEVVLNQTGAAALLENLLGRFQRAKIARNTTNYPANLPAPAADSTHLVFYYPRVLSVRREWRAIMACQFGHSENDRILTKLSSDKVRTF